MFLALLIGITAPVKSQETDRTPFAIEFPELESGFLTKPKESIASANVNVVKFWMLNPVAATIDWGRIKVRINRQSANKLCAQVPASQGKVMRCDLNMYAGFRLQGQENFFEIEAAGTDGKRFFASFIVATEPKLAKKGAVTTGFSGRRFAVVIGVSRYIYNDAGLGNLEYADDDAEAMNEWLKGKGGFTPDNILFMTNEKATLNSVRDSLGRFLTKATENDLVLFFLAGHGTPDPFNPNELYYLVADSKVTDLKNTGLPMTELKRIIDRDLKSKRVVFLLDTCHSAGLNGREGARSGNSVGGSRSIATGNYDERQLTQVEVKNDVSQRAGQLFGSPGRAVITSSGAGETSREASKWGGGHGVFTWALLEGLNGKADKNGDMRVTAAELYDYISDRVRLETNFKQNPQLFSLLANDLDIALLK